MSNYDQSWSPENEYLDQSADVMIALDSDEFDLDDQTQAAIFAVIEPIIRGIWDTALAVGHDERKQPPLDTALL